MYRFSNTVIGYLNLLTLLASIPIIGGGLWLARSSATCESSLQTPILVLGFLVLLVSLAGFVGACFNVAWALWLYLFVMLFLIAALLGLIAFGFAVTGGGRGVEVAGRVYHEYRLGDYSGWLRRRITEPRYWDAALACVVGSKTCAKIALWTPLDYLQRDLSPIQSGCCKPPTSCTYTEGAAMAAQDEDCYKWNNAPNILCYACDSCKAGVLEQVRMDWHKLTVLNVVVLIILIAIYSIGCCAFRNARRAESEYPYGENRMSKIHPRWDYYWYLTWLFSSYIFLDVTLCFDDRLNFALLVSLHSEQEYS
ncbi:tetraspanin-6 [Canna indica]|uniref:Tetraspanin-6 n=1 Tax=Canna indica TaxID=4628 RepID=A0AAQ3KCE6_9LILI|nr:tetraspanin-6 [Canna indica]